MNLLLTSAGLTNPTIIQTLRDMLGKPTQESVITVIPTGHTAEQGDKSWVLQEDYLLPHRLGWKQFNIVDLAAVASLDKSLWWPQLEQSDVILVGGGSVFYLSYWMQNAGLFDVLPKWLESKLYVGTSAGSQVICSDLYASVEIMEREGVFNDTDYDEIGPTGQSSSRTLKLVSFTFRPHLNSQNFPNIRLSYLENLAQTLKTPMYAIDDNCAIKVTNNQIEVVGGGQWHRFEAGNSPLLGKDTV